MGHYLDETRLLLVVFFSAAVIFTSAPLASADAMQKDTPGAQGTEGTNPTHQDADVTGPNGEHAANTNPANTPPAPTHHKKKHHKKTCSVKKDTTS